MLRAGMAAPTPSLRRLPPSERQLHFPSAWLRRRRPSRCPPGRTGGAVGADGRADRDPDVVRADEIREPGASGDQPQGSSGSAAAQLGEDDQLAQLKAEAAQRFRALSGDPAEREKLREMLKARRERDGQPVVLPNLPRKGAARPYVTVALLAASWAVFLAQWVPALAQLPGQPGALRVLLASLVGAACPETQLTAALQLDVAALEAGQHLRVATSALLHPGLLPFLLSMDGCYEVAGGLERTLGSAQTLAMLLLVAAGTAAGQYILSTQRFFMAGPGLMAGMYAAQLVKACMRPDVPLTTTKAVTYTALVAGVAYIQPLFGWAGMIGSLAGGVIAGLLSWQAVHLVRVAIALPLVGTALLLRTALQLPKLALTALGAAFRLSWSTLLAIISSFKQSFS